ncbi:MAG TPA: hypothetical protein VK473_11235 [Terriglobales bacterium]|nr:hypothetical protein [Terriglobales bacterium]
MKWLSKARGAQVVKDEAALIGVSRPTRFKLRTQLRYRCSSEFQWHDGITENISCTGVLFRAEGPVEPRTPITLRFTLPQAIAGQTPIEVTCDAYVVRRANIASPEDKGFAIAATILNYHLPVERQIYEPVVGAAVAETTAIADPAQVIHQLNGQLAVVIGNCDLILSHAQLDDNLRKSVDSIRNAGLRVATLIRERIAKAGH